MQRLPRGLLGSLVSRSCTGTAVRKYRQVVAPPTGEGDAAGAETGAGGKGETGGRSDAAPAPSMDDDDDCVVPGASLRSSRSAPVFVTRRPVALLFRGRWTHAGAKLETPRTYAQ